MVAISNEGLNEFLDKIKGSIPFVQKHFLSFKRESGLIMVTSGETILYVACYAKLKEASNDLTLRSIASENDLKELKIRFRIGEFVDLKQVESQLIKQFQPKYNLI